MAQNLRSAVLGVLLCPALCAQVPSAPKALHHGAPGLPPVWKVTQDVIDFEGHPAGTVLGQVFSAGGLGPVVVSGSNPAIPGENAAVVFDSSMPTGMDEDLGTPNETFGGPGVGLGGEAGSAFPNDTALGNSLIVAENLVDADFDLLVDDPDDVDLLDSLLMFDFSALGGVTLESLTIVDVEGDEAPAEAQFYDAANALIGTQVLPIVGDNGVAVVDLGGVAGVSTLIVLLNGSGAVDNVAFAIVEQECTGRIGDFVWLDLNGDGIQDADEPGIAGVRLELFDEAGMLVAEQSTDSSGHYLFEGLCAGTYLVCVDESTLPDCVEPSPCDQGTSDRVDSECSCSTVVLFSDDSIWRIEDFGYVPGDCGGEGCTPGYWKQSQHFDSWPAPYAPEMLFDAVFEDAFPGMTLLQVLSNGGGGLAALGRHTVAALLNGASDGVDYPLSDGDVVDLFDGVFPGSKGDYNDLKDVLEDNNEEGCPLD